MDLSGFFHVSDFFSVQGLDSQRAVTSISVGAGGKLFGDSGTYYRYCSICQISH